MRNETENIEIKAELGESATPQEVLEMIDEIRGLEDSLKEAYKDLNDSFNKPIKQALEDGIGLLQNRLDNL